MRGHRSEDENGSRVVKHTISSVDKGNLHCYVGRDLLHD